MTTDQERTMMILGAGLFLFFISNRAKAAPGTPNPPDNYPGSLSESYLHIQPTASNRGIRNNNPGNVKFGPSQWNGKVPEIQNTDAKITDPQHSRFGQPTFEQNYTYPGGIRMMIYLVKKYIDVKNFETIDSIINEWAAGGNENYKNYLAQRLGIARTDVISSTDEPAIKKIVQSIANFENGQWGINDPEVIHSLSYDAARSIL